MPKLYVHVLEYYVTIKKNEVELYILKGLQDLMLPKSKLQNMYNMISKNLPKWCMCIYT